MYKIRQLLILVCLAVALLGCAEDEVEKASAGESLKIEEQITPTPTISPDDDESWVALMRSALSEKIDVQTIKVADGRDKGGVKAVIVAYTSHAETKEDIAREIGYITGVFLKAKQAGWDIDELMAVIGNEEGKAIGTWYCKKEWAEKYVNGEMTLEDVGANVLKTIQVLS